jgi:hypothetical protein
MAKCRPCAFSWRWGEGCALWVGCVLAGCLEGGFAAFSKRTSILRRDRRVFIGTKMAQASTASRAAPYYEVLVVKFYNLLRLLCWQERPARRALASYPSQSQERPGRAAGWKQGRGRGGGGPEARQQGS